MLGVHRREETEDATAMPPKIGRLLLLLICLVFGKKMNPASSGPFLSARTVHPCTSQCFRSLPSPLCGLFRKTSHLKAIQKASMAYHYHPNP